MSKIIWRKGPPPSPGWWPTTISGRAILYRWYEHGHWSKPTGPCATAEEASESARIPSFYSTRTIKWTDRPAWWPKRSRT
jgi:hypothetical protein